MTTTADQCQAAMGDSVLCDIIGKLVRAQRSAVVDSRAYIAEPNAFTRRMKQASHHRAVRYEKDAHRRLSALGIVRPIDCKVIVNVKARALRSSI